MQYKYAGQKCTQKANLKQGTHSKDNDRHLKYENDHFIHDI